MGGAGGAVAVVLAGGDGKRLRSAVPKVLHQAAGLPLLVHVLRALDQLPLDETVIVTSPRKPEVEAALATHGFGGLSFAVQENARGTADALRIGLGSINADDGVVLVVTGDSPLLVGATLARLLMLHRSTSSAATILTAPASRDSDFGRVVREGDEIVRIVEIADATDTELDIEEVNAGVYVFNIDKVRAALEKVDHENAQGEFYLTDVVALLRSQDLPVAGLMTTADEVRGVNDRKQLAEASALLRRRVCDRLMSEGVGIVDPDTTYIDASVEVAGDATILPFTFLEGATRVAAGAEIGPQARIIDSDIGEGAKVSFAVVRGSTVGTEATVGPFASLRPGTKLERGARVGTFVETKETTIGEGSKANHLSYLGDATIGKGVNVGAGTITCNWDGREKHQTVIDDDAYIASDTMIVAPAHIGKGAATGAGAVVRGDVPDGALAVGVPARIIEGKGNKMKKPHDPDEEPRQ